MYLERKLESLKKEHDSRCFQRATWSASVLYNSTWYFAKLPNLMCFFFIPVSARVFCQRRYVRMTALKSMVFSYSDYLAFFCNLSLFLPEIRLWSCCTMRDSGEAVIWGWAERDQRQTVNFHSQSLSLPHVTLLSQHSMFPRFLTWHVGIVVYLYLFILVAYWIFNLCMLISWFYI